MTRTSPRWRWLVAVVVVLGVVAAACGSSDDKSTDGSSEQREQQGAPGRDDHRHRAPRSRLPTTTK